jgi:hypothetical protein
MLSPFFFSLTPYHLCPSMCQSWPWQKNPYSNIIKFSLCTSISHAHHLSYWLSDLSCSGMCEVRTGKSCGSSSGSWTLTHHGWWQSFFNSLPFSELLHWLCHLAAYHMVVNLDVWNILPVKTASHYKLHRAYFSLLFTLSIYSMNGFWLDFCTIWCMLP